MKSARFNSFTVNCYFFVKLVATEEPDTIFLKESLFVRKRSEATTKTEKLKQGHMQFFAAKEQRTVLNKSSLTQLLRSD